MDACSAFSMELQMPLRLHSLMVVPPVSAYQMVSGVSVGCGMADGVWLTDGSSVGFNVVVGAELADGSCVGSHGLYVGCSHGLYVGSHGLYVADGVSVSGVSGILLSNTSFFVSGENGLNVIE